MGEGVRANVYLPKALLDAADAFGEAAGMSRSSMFGLALRRFLLAELTEEECPRATNR